MKGTEPSEAARNTFFPVFFPRSVHLNILGIICQINIKLKGRTTKADWLGVLGYKELHHGEYPGFLFASYSPG